VNKSVPEAAPKSGRGRQTLRGIAALLMLATLVFWAAKGAHTGWSKDQVPIKQTDEVTGIEFVTYEERFVPGVEFLAAGAGLAAGLFALSFLVQRKSIKS
jgi:hypothetical protein